MHLIRIKRSTTYHLGRVSHKSLFWAQGVFGGEHEHPLTSLAMSPYFLSFLFALREKQFNIPLGERRQRTQGLHASVTLSFPNNHSLSDSVLQATKPIFFWTHNIENCTCCPPKTFPNDILSSATTAFGLEHNMAQESHNFSIRTGKHFKSQLEELHHQRPELEPCVMSAHWQQPWGLGLQAIKYDIMMTSWKEEFNSQPWGYQLLLYSKTCHHVREQWAESIISTAFYGPHKFGTLRPQPPPPVSPSPSVGSHNAPSRSQHYKSHSRENQSSSGLEITQITQIWPWGHQVPVSSAHFSLPAGLTQLDAPWTNTCTTTKSHFKFCLGKHSQADASRRFPGAGCPSHPLPQHLPVHGNKGFIHSCIKHVSHRQRWTCSPVRQVEYFGAFFMIRWYQSVYSHEYHLAHVIIHTFNSVFITPQAVIRDGFFIRFLT